LLIGAEYAYEQVAAEWTAKDPDFDGFVRSGAMGSRMGALLAESAAKYKANKLRPSLITTRVAAQVRLDSYG